MVVQWFRNHLAMQGVRVPSLVRELNPTSVGQLNLSARKKTQCSQKKKIIITVEHAQIFLCLNNI